MIISPATLTTQWERSVPLNTAWHVSWKATAIGTDWLVGVVFGGSAGACTSGPLGGVWVGVGEIAERWVMARGDIEGFPSQLGLRRELVVLRGAGIGGVRTTLDSSLDSVSCLDPDVFKLSVSSMVEGMFE